MRLDEKKKCFECLKEAGYIEYGTLIPRDVLEEAFDEKLENNPDFVWKLLTIKQYIEEDGYLCTTENISKGDLYIYDTDEFNERTEVLRNRVLRKMNRLQNSMRNAKTQEFNQKDFQAHLHNMSKVAAGLNALNSIFFRL